MNDELKKFKSFCLKEYTKYTGGFRKFPYGEENTVERDFYINCEVIYKTYTDCGKDIYLFAEKIGLKKEDAEPFKEQHYNFLFDNIMILSILDAQKTLLSDND